VTDPAFAPCPPDCTVPPDLHRHFHREPGVYFRLAAPLACCGREWMREDEILLLDQCRWCWADHGTLAPGMGVTLVQPYTVIRDSKRGRRR
jgi:hypothetical protein